MMVGSDFGSFPSGHAANAAVMVVVAALLVRRAWLWAAGALYVLAMMVSRTYLAVHWLGDTVGGALLGVGVAAGLWVVFAPKVAGEAARRRKSLR
jgi:undecaprenyl-diphosphatase